MKTKYLLTVLIVSISIVVTNGQIPVRQQFSGKKSALMNIWGDLNKTPVLVIPRQNVEQLKLEDLRERIKPFRFGKAVPFRIGLKDGIWTELDSGRVWTVSIIAEGAVSINLLFEKLVLSEESEMYVSNDGGNMVMGPITTKYVSNQGVFRTDVIAGDKIIVSLFEPYWEYGKNELEISEIVYGYRELTDYLGFGDSAPCHNDIACPQGNGWREEGDAVALVIVNGIETCTGILLNNGCQDFTPSFLTAFHCVDSDGNGVLSTAERDAVLTWGFRFQYESPTCSGPEDQEFWFLAGSTFRAAWQTSDFALLELNNRPLRETGIRYAGWSRVAAAATSSVGIHHPRGDVMKISTENNAALSVAWFGGPADTHWRATFDDGTIEHGSSGSPLFDQNERVVGQLHGNQNNICPSEDNSNCFCTQPRVGEYGRFDRSWNGGGTANTRLSTWLTNDPAVTQTNTIPIPFITGPSLVCASANSVFTISEVPIGQTVTWSVDQPRLVQVTPNNTSVTLRAVNNARNGEVTLTATLSSGVLCLSEATFTKDFWVGNPRGVTTNPNGVPAIEAQIGSIININATSVPGATISSISSLNWWTNNSSALDLNPGYGVCVVECLAIGYNYVYVTSSNTCGTSPYRLIPVDVTSEGGGGQQFLDLSPNPSNGVFNIEIKDLDNSKLDQRIEIVIYDSYQNKVFQSTFYGESTTIDLTNQQKGFYYLHLFYDQKHVQRTLIFD